MDEGKTYVNVKFGETNAQSPSNDGLTATYAELNFSKDETLIAESEDHRNASRPGEQPITAQTVSQIHQSKVTSDRNYHKLKSTLQSKLSAFNCNRSILRNQFTEMETKYRSVNETKAQICELLTIRREQTFSQEWIRNEDGCYFISTFKYYYKEAKEYCLSTDSKLLEINSAEEEIFISKAVHDQGISYWIGKCKDGEVASNALGRINGGDFECGKCTPYSENKPCDQVRTRFICEKSAPLCPDISEKIQGLCHQPVGPN
ncbi:oxidized low-density lipoprotein receptor 1-like [Hypanus sabinus]|uniref:oxidized low-density lipoprotein receptor 1-like n=1 Tax=Hypanus sabinus TaxID=79690 RepID=UPI0028C3B436|nr:oxidized low-density lipoprotein receptor 1-like [Hypanus sabinus]